MMLNKRRFSSWISRVLGNKRRPRTTNRARRSGSIAPLHAPVVAEALERRDLLTTVVNFADAAAMTEFDGDGVGDTAGVTIDGTPVTFTTTALAPGGVW